MQNYFALLSALGLMTRIPIGWFCFGAELTAEQHNRGQIWYPWAGAIIGLVLAVILSLVLWLLPWSSLLLSVLLLAAWVAITGALHLDGLADSVDAWVGGIGSREKTLAIMKDPACGPMAVAALVIVLLLKVALIYQLLDSLGVAPVALVLVSVPMLARSWLLPLLYRTPYARKVYDAHSVQTSERMAFQGRQRGQGGQGGMATDIATDFPCSSALISFVVCQALVIGLFFVLGIGLAGWLLTTLVAIFVALSIQVATMRRIGGYTGDVLGAFIELQEVALLLAICCLV